MNSVGVLPQFSEWEAESKGFSVQSFVDFALKRCLYVFLMVHFTEEISSERKNDLARVTRVTSITNHTSRAWGFRRAWLAATLSSRVTELP